MRLIIIGFFVILALPDHAHAARSGARFDPLEMLRKADVDRDGTVTRDEFRAGRSRLFDRLDRNDDGQISSADAPRRLARRSSGERLRELVQTLDSDRDGRLTRGEFVQAPGLFDRADRNRDGRVDPAERADLESMLPR